MTIENESIALRPVVKGNNEKVRATYDPETYMLRLTTPLEYRLMTSERGWSDGTWIRGRRSP